MTTQYIELEIRGIPLECEYEWDPGEKQTWDHPGFPPGAFLVRCSVGERNIIDLLDDHTIHTIEEAIALKVQE